MYNAGLHVHVQYAADVNDSHGQLENEYDYPARFFNQDESIEVKENEAYATVINA